MGECTAVGTARDTPPNGGFSRKRSCWATLNQYKGCRPAGRRPQSPPLTMEAWVVRRLALVRLLMSDFQLMAHAPCSSTPGNFPYNSTSNYLVRLRT